MFKYLAALLLLVGCNSVPDPSYSQIPTYQLCLRLLETVETNGFSSEVGFMAQELFTKRQIPMASCAQARVDLELSKLKE